MKTKDEFEALEKKLAELTEDELEQVTGGVTYHTQGMTGELPDNPGHMIPGFEEKRMSNRPVSNTGNPSPLTGLY